MTIKASGKGEKRIALVIGNGGYKFVSPLGNPTNDAGDMAATLRFLGFEVITGTDTNLVQMRRLIREFGEKLEAAKGVGLFFYAGHGVEVRGRNFLVPVDADIGREVETEDYAIDLNTVLRQMDAANNGFNIVILDACRNNPFARGWSRSGDTGGLANILAPTGTYIAFAAAPGSTASDGKGTRNGIFTGALLKNLKRPNLKLEEVFKATREEVMNATINKQVPWDSSSVKGEFYFIRANTQASGEPTRNETLTAKDVVAVEREAWSYVRDSQNPQDFRDFLKDFPSGANAGNAKIKLEQAAWDAVRDSKDKSKLQAYLSEFPAGVNAPLAKIRLRQSDAPVAAPPSNTGGNAATGSAGAVRKNSIGMEMVYIPPGEFMMGSSEDDIAEAFYKAQQEFKDAKREWFDAEKPQHKVRIGEGFWMGRYEVTQAQWRSVMGDNPSNFNGCDTCPVETVSWDDAKVFLRKLNQSNDGFIYSLPSEAQWEYAARAGTKGLWAGNLDEMGWYNKNSSSKTHPVGQKQANAFGLYDMHGNVWEWCEDYYGPYSTTDVTDPKGAASGQARVLRGGSWGNVASYSRSAVRVGNASSNRSNDNGFRVLARPS
ncbi:MAG: SUMF1/EgtB/PvdO family nonheme iron enzyme [Pyrinomonadaceae bacterium]